jgi:hypothetical protein
MNSMFNLEDYDPVEKRLGVKLNAKSFWEDYPEGRIETKLVAHTSTQYIVWAAIYRDSADVQPWSTGLAEETVQVRGVNSTSALENCETSALGRALANAGYATKGKRASREEMTKVNAGQPKPFAEKLADKITMPVEDDPWTTKAVTTPPTAAEAVALVQDVLGAVKIDKDIPLCRNCHDHKPMTWQTGVSAKNSKPWARFSCYACKDVMWYQVAADGSWKPQEVRV